MISFRRIASLAFDVYAVFTSYICIQAVIYESFRVSSTEGGYVSSFQFRFPCIILCFYMLSLVAFSVCLTVSAFRRTGSRRSFLWLLCWMVFNILLFMFISPQAYMVAEYSIIIYSHLPEILYTILRPVFFVLVHTAAAVWLMERIAAAGSVLKRTGCLLCIVGSAGTAAAIVRAAIIMARMTAVNSPSVGIIGGADGPTAQFITNSMRITYGDALFGRFSIVFPILLITGFVLCLRAKRYPADIECAGK